MASRSRQSWSSRTAQLRERFRVSISTPATTDRRGTSASGTPGTSWTASRGDQAADLACAAARGVLYLPLSQSTPGFVRDSLFIVSDACSRWQRRRASAGERLPVVLRAAPPRVLKRWIRLTLRRVDSVAVMGDSLRWVFAGLVPDERIAVVPNGTPDPSPNPPNGTRNHVLFLSNLRRRKGVIEARRCSIARTRADPVREVHVRRELGERRARERVARTRPFRQRRCDFEPPVEGRGEGPAFSRQRRSCSSRPSSRRATRVSFSRRSRPEFRW